MISLPHQCFTFDHNPLEVLPSPTQKSEITRRNVHHVFGKKSEVSPFTFEKAESCWDLAEMGLRSSY